MQDLSEGCVSKCNMGVAARRYEVSAKAPQRGSGEEPQETNT